MVFRCTKNIRVESPRAREWPHDFYFTSLVQKTKQQTEGIRASTELTQSLDNDIDSPKWFSDAPKMFNCIQNALTAAR
jgi:hypothetical protein